MENVHLTDSLVTLSYAARRQDEYSCGTIIGRGEHGRIKSAVPYQRGGFAFGGTA